MGYLAFVIGALVFLALLLFLRGGSIIITRPGGGGESFGCWKHIVSRFDAERATYLVFLGIALALIPAPAPIPAPALAPAPAPAPTAPARAPAPTPALQYFAIFEFMHRGES